MTASQRHFHAESETVLRRQRALLDTLLSDNRSVQQQIDLYYNEVFHRFHNAHSTSFSRNCLLVASQDPGQVAPHRLIVRLRQNHFCDIYFNLRKRHEL